MSESTTPKEEQGESDEIKIAIGPRVIPPGAVATSKMDLSLAEVPEGTTLVPVAVDLDPDCADHFEVLFASRGDEVLLAGEGSTLQVDGVDVPARIGSRIHLRIFPAAEGPLLVVVRNKSLGPHLLRGSLVCEAFPRAEPEPRWSKLGRIIP